MWTRGTWHLKGCAQWHSLCKKGHQIFYPLILFHYFIKIVKFCSAYLEVHFARVVVLIARNTWYRCHPMHIEKQYTASQLQITVTVYILLCTQLSGNGKTCSVHHCMPLKTNKDLAAYIRYRIWRATDNRRTFSSLSRYNITTNSHQEVTGALWHANS